MLISVFVLFFNKLGLLRLASMLGLMEVSGLMKMTALGWVEWRVECVHLNTEGNIVSRHMLE